MTVNMTTTTKVDFQGQMTVAELQALLEGLPGSATVSFQHHPGTDQRDPSYTTMTVTHPRGSAVR